MRRVWVGLLLVVALVPVGPEPAAACSPRTFSSIQPPALEVGSATPSPQVEAPPPDEEPPPPEPPPVEPPPTEVPPPADPPAAEVPPPVEEPSVWVPPPPVCSFVYRMGFPVVGGGSPGWSLFGEPRDGGARLHAGVDILAPKLTPVVAVRAGVISGVHDDPGDCCWVSVRHTDGWVSMYVHLNNDTAGTNDGQGVGIRPDLVEGLRVEQGELLGWIGNSGNAEGGPAHIHFELRTPWGEPIDPGPSLYSARRRAHPGLVDLALDARFAGAYVDYATDSIAQVFDTATALGIPGWCDQWGIMACPGDVATQEAVTRWITALGGATDVPRLFFTAVHPVDDPTAYLSIFDGCDLPPLCGQSVTRGEVAALVVRALQPALELDEAHALGHLQALGVVDACDPRGLDANQVLTRLGALKMLLRAWGYLPAPPCGLIS